MSTSSWGRTIENDSRKKFSVLLVDDDYPCLDTFTDVLDSLGYTVRGVGSGAAALDIFSREPHSFSLVILDHIMPYPTGIVTAQEMLQIRADTPIVLLTGWFLSDDTKRYAKKIGIRKILEKPIRVQQLDHVIQKILRDENEI